MLAHIVRIDTGGTHGWQARIGTSKKSLKYSSKFFSDSRHGGSRKARKLAEEYLRSNLTALGFPNHPLGRRVGMQFIDEPEKRSRANTSGRTGVYRSRLKRRRGGKVTVQDYWAAHYTIGATGERKKGIKRFFYGQTRTEREAKKLAVEFRSGWEDAFRKEGAKGLKRFFREWKDSHPRS